jgi:hypothetical protein
MLVLFYYLVTLGVNFLDKEYLSILNILFAEESELWSKSVQKVNLLLSLTRFRKLNNLVVHDGVKFDDLASLRGHYRVVVSDITRRLS